jgi:hypothetical protein
MPRVGQSSRDMFEEGLTRAKKGGLWRHYDGRTVSVFQRSDHFYSWCIADDTDRRYSRAAFESEEEAVDSLCSELFC